MIDNKKKCGVENCNNLGEFDKKIKEKVYRRKYCHKHGNHTLKQRLKSQKDFMVCEYCGWIGPCDIHRVNWESDGGKYTADNIRSTCPNCHRLITYRLIEDKFKIKKN